MKNQIIQQYTYPYNHLIIDNFLPDELYNSFIEHIVSNDLKSFIKNNTTYDNDGNTAPGDFIDKFVHSYNNNGSARDIEQYTKDYLSNVKLNGFKWKGYFESSTRSFIPHTDDVELTYRTTSDHSGIVKGLIYFTHPDYTYHNLGTVLYDSNLETRPKLKEIEFIPNRLFLFDTNRTTWHGTDFFNELSSAQMSVEERRNFDKNKKQILNPYRITYNFEYVYRGTLDNSIYKKIDYQNVNDLSFRFYKKL